MSGGPDREIANRNLARANWVRRQRAEMKRGLKAREIEWYPLLRGDSSEWEQVISSIRLDKLMLMIPGVGEAIMEDVLSSLVLSGRLEIRGLTYERRAQLADVLRAVMDGEPIAPMPTGPPPMRP